MKIIHLMIDSTNYYSEIYCYYKKTYFVVFNGISAGCYSSHDDAYEAAWDSDEPVREYSSLSAAQYAFKKFMKKKHK